MKVFFTLIVVILFGVQSQSGYSQTAISTYGEFLLLSYVVDKACGEIDVKYIDSLVKVIENMKNKEANLTNKTNMTTWLSNYRSTFRKNCVKTENYIPRRGGGGSVPYSGAGGKIPSKPIGTGGSSGGTYDIRNDALIINPTGDGLQVIQSYTIKLDPALSESELNKTIEFSLDELTKDYTGKELTVPESKHGFSTSLKKFTSNLLKNSEGKTTDAEKKQKETVYDILNSNSNIKIGDKEWKLEKKPNNSVKEALKYKLVPP